LHASLCGGSIVVDSLPVQNLDLIGIGLLLFKKPAYQLLLYFSSVIILSKILIWLEVLQLNGALETTIPSEIKRSISLLYHVSIIYFLTRPGVKKLFHE
jgi:hypothetical protein